MPKGFKGGKGKGGGKSFGGGKGGFGGGDDQGGKGGKKGKMKAMFNMMMQSWGGDGGSDSGSGQANHKGELSTAYHRSLKGTGQEKGEVAYETHEVEGKQKSYQSVVTIAGNTYTGEITPGKKASEHSAAQVALAEMFPDHQGAAAGDSWAMPPSWMQEMAGGGEGGGGKKRSREENSAQPLTAKTKLVQGLQLILGRPSGKEDVVWQVEEAEGGKHIGSVSLTGMDKTFTGEPSDSKKGAENNAAQAALDALQDQLTPLAEEHKAKKTKKNKENLDKLKARLEEKKAEKEAGKAAKAEA